MKKVNVVIPAYNKRDLTVKTVKSVLNQTYKNVEVIVVDDGSTDGTGEKLLAAFGDRIKYVRKKNGGVSSARNLGIKMSSGDYIGLLDCDDIYLPQKIEKSVEYLEKRLTVGFVYTRGKFMLEGGRTRLYPFLRHGNTGFIARWLILKNFICNSTVLARKSCFAEAGDFDESIFIPADWDMWLRLSEKYQAGYIDEPLTRFSAVNPYTLGNLAEQEKDRKYVIDKALKRKPHFYKSMANVIWSNFHFWMALNHTKVNDLEKAERQLSLAVENNNANMKAWIFLATIKILGKRTGAIMKALKIF